MTSSDAHAYFALIDPSGHVWLTDGKRMRLECINCGKWTSIRLFEAGEVFPPCPNAEGGEE